MRGHIKKKLERTVLRIYTVRVLQALDISKSNTNTGTILLNDVFIISYVGVILPQQCQELALHWKFVTLVKNFAKSAYVVYFVKLVIYNKSVPYFNGHVAVTG